MRSCCVSDLYAILEAETGEDPVLTFGERRIHRTVNLLEIPRLGDRDPERG